MANHIRPQMYRGRRRQKENVGPIKNPHNMGSIISDKEALKIHGLNFESNGYSSDSDSGKSDFDEEYFKNKPQPLPINRKKVVTIKRLNTRNEQPQLKKSILLNTEMKKDFSNLTSGRSGTGSTSFKRKFNDVVATDQSKYKNIEIVNPCIRPNLNKFPANENNFSSLKDITCQPSTANNSTLKRLSTSGVVGTLTKNEDTVKNLSETQIQSSLPVISNEPAFHSLYLQMQKELSADRSVRPMQTPSKAQTYTESKMRASIRPNDHKNKFHRVSTASEETTKSRTNTIPAHKPQNSSSAASNYHSLTLNVSNLPEVLPKVADSSRSTRKSLPSNNTRDPVPPHIVTNTFRAQTVNSPNRNFGWSPHRDIFAGESRNITGGSADTGGSSESARLCGDISSSFCGRCIDFILCRRC